MKRRKFLQNILKVTAIASVPAVVIHELVTQPNYPFVAAGNINFSENLTSDPDVEWIINQKTGCIEFIGEKIENDITLQQLRQFIKDDWDCGDELVPFKFDIATVDKITHGFKGYYTI